MALPAGNGLGAGVHLTLQACLSVRPGCGPGNPLCTLQTVVSMLGVGVGAHCSPVLLQRVRARGGEGGRRLGWNNVLHFLSLVTLPALPPLGPADRAWVLWLARSEKPLALPMWRVGARCSLCMLDL